MQSLNPKRDVPRGFDLNTVERDSRFREVADSAVAGFRAARGELERGVRRGDLTVKSAREQARAAASRVKELLHREIQGYSRVPRVFAERLADANAARRRQRENASLEGLQRETNRLLRLGLVEQQMLSRASEFEGRAFRRPMSGGSPAPTLESLLSFHREVDRANDDAAREWARRQLETMRPLILDESDLRRIDDACDRPERISEAIVAKYLEALRGADGAVLESFVEQAIEARDASACAAAFLLAREVPDATSARWVRKVLDGLAEFPDAALNALNEWEADARRIESDAARALADFAIRQVENESRLGELRAPTDAEMSRAARVESIAPASPNEPIGLVPRRLESTGGELPPSDATPVAEAPSAPPTS